MQPRRKLEMDSLAVDSFETAAEDTGARGTVEAQGAACTSPATCKCQTSLYACGTIRATAYSCPPTLVCA
jgi:hypothetical protein